MLLIMCMFGLLCSSTTSSPTATQGSPVDDNTPIAQYVDETSSQAIDGSVAPPEEDEQLSKKSSERFDLNFNSLLNRLVGMEKEAIADKREMIFKFNEVLTKLNALRDENLQLKNEKRADQITIDRLSNRLSLLEERWQEKRWLLMPDDVTDLHRKTDALSSKLESQELTIQRLRDESLSQDSKLRRSSDDMQKVINDLRKEFRGYSSMTFAFAQQTSQALNASESRLKETLEASTMASRNLYDRLQNKFQRLSDQTELTVSRLDVWNATRQLTQCQKFIRDSKQEQQIMFLVAEFVELKKQAGSTSNRTRKLESILYENNRITNGLSSFRRRASTTIEKLIKNIDQLVKSFPTDCNAVQQFEKQGLKVQVILPNYELGQIKAVKCQFSGANGWTVIQNRDRLNVDFNKKWKEYEKGFGDVNGDYWLGLEMIHQLVSSGDWKLRIEMWDTNGRFYYAVYTRFLIRNRDLNYQLEVSGYHGNATDTFSRSSGTGFSATDFDDDSTVVHCARFEEAGWWMKHCHESNLNGKEPYGIIWYHQLSKEYLTLSRTRMMVAPVREEDLTTTTTPRTSTTGPETTQTTTMYKSTEKNKNGTRNQDLIDGTSNLFINYTEDDQNFRTTQTVPVSSSSVLSRRNVTEKNERTPVSHSSTTDQLSIVRSDERSTSSGVLNTSSPTDSSDSNPIGTLKPPLDDVSESIDAQEVNTESNNDLSSSDKMAEISTTATVIKSSKGIQSASHRPMSKELLGVTYPTQFDISTHTSTLKGRLLSTTLKTMTKTTTTTARTTARTSAATTAATTARTSAATTARTTARTSVVTTARTTARPSAATTARPSAVTTARTTARTSAATTAATTARPSAATTAITTARPSAATTARTTARSSAATTARTTARTSAATTAGSTAPPSAATTARTTAPPSAATTARTAARESSATTARTTAQTSAATTAATTARTAARESAATTAGTTARPSAATTARTTARTSAATTARTTAPPSAATTARTVARESSATTAGTTAQTSAATTARTAARESITRTTPTNTQPSSSIKSALIFGEGDESVTEKIIVSTTEKEKKNRREPREKIVKRIEAEWEKIKSKYEN